MISVVFCVCFLFFECLWRKWVLALTCSFCSAQRFRINGILNYSLTLVWWFEEKSQIVGGTALPCVVRWWLSVHRLVLGGSSRLP